MRVREWQEILQDVIDRDVDPRGWRAAGGRRASGVGEDLYLGHRKAGLYHLKTYAKNPYQVRGVGTRVARKLDDEIGSYLPEKDSREGRFAVRNPTDERPEEKEAKARAKHLEEVLKAHADAPTSGADLFDDVMEAIESPAFGPMDFDGYDRPESVGSLSETFEESEKLLNSELEDLIDEDDVGRGFQ
ncbi:hypothetical protein [Haladaptatus caseinilyticus]|uniref:hypothetical protein n=1 Tax=Haladaptatus caseinilyticus TaxID=2993314 RepID=UPI00224A8033|nr:hypothetical protein [Haladaptatus caseinilyticus]